VRFGGPSANSEPSWIWKQREGHGRKGSGKANGMSATSPTGGILHMATQHYLQGRSSR